MNSTAKSESKPALTPVKTKMVVKKTDIRQCRLCLRVLPRDSVRETRTPTSDIRRKILDAVAVKIAKGDKVTTICTNCLLLVDILYCFRMACRKADTIHATRLMMLHPGNWLGDKNRDTLEACHELVKRNRAEMDGLFKCSGLDRGEIHHLRNPKEVVLESKEDPVLEVDNVTDSEPEMSEQLGRKIDEDAKPLFENKDNSHLRRSHDSSKIMCEICGSMVLKHHLEYHKNQHLDTRPYKCTIGNCSSDFYSAQALDRHVKVIHSESTEELECNICHKVFKNSRYHYNHMKVHAGVSRTRKKPCRICGKLYYPGYLKDHMNVHTNTLCYACEFCGKRYNAKNNLTIHHNKRHKNEMEETSAS